MDKIREQIDAIRVYGLHDEDARATADTMEAMLEVVEMVATRTHFCGGRDCVGYAGTDSGSQYQCHDCHSMAAKLAKLENQGKNDE